MIFSFRFFVVCSVLFGSFSVFGASKYDQYDQILKKVHLKKTLTSQETQNLRRLLYSKQFAALASDFIQNKTDKIDFKDLIVAIPSSDVLYSFLDDSLGEMLARTDQGNPGDKGKYYAWYWGFWGRALLYAYEATHEMRYLDLFVTTFEKLLSERDDRLQLVDTERHRIVKSWGVRDSVRFRADIRTNEVTNCGLINLPVTEFLILVGKDSVLRKKYDSVYEKYLNAAAESVKEFEADYRLTDFGGGYYWSLFTHDIEPINHTHVLAANFANLYVLTQDPFYKKRVAEIGTYFKKFVVIDKDNNWTWPYNPLLPPLSLQYFRGLGVFSKFVSDWIQRFRRLPEGMWKAAVSIQFPIAAYNSGLFFDKTDMENMVDSFLKNGSDDHQLYQTLSSHHTVIKNDKRSTVLVTGGLAPWLLYSQINPRVNDVVVKIMSNNPEIFSNSWFGGSRSMVMGLALLMKNVSKGEHAPTEN